MQLASAQVVILQDFKWYDFILKLHKLYNGTHLSVKNVFSRRCVLSLKAEICMYLVSFYWKFFSTSVACSLS